jgi:hypothetical protein
LGEFIDQLVNVLVSGGDGVLQHGLFRFRRGRAQLEAGAVFRVLTERAKEGIEEIVAELGGGVTGLLGFREAFAEGFDQPFQFPFKMFKGVGGRHGAEFAAARPAGQARGFWHPFRVAWICGSDSGGSRSVLAHGQWLARLPANFCHAFSVQHG